MDVIACITTYDDVSIHLGALHVYVLGRSNGRCSDVGEIKIIIIYYIVCDANDYKDIIMFDGNRKSREKDILMIS